MKRKYNTQNLINAAMKTPEQRKIDSTTGGIKSGIVKRRNKTIKESLLMLAQMDFNMEDDKKVRQKLEEFGISVTEQEIATFNLYQRAKNNAKDFEVMRDSSGQKPTDKVANVTVDDGRLAETIISEHFGV
jgi:translation elongation factor EF-Ts